MATTLQAPFPIFKVTTVLPNHLFEDGRRPESTVQIKRKADGTVITYVQSSDRETLTLPFRLTRQKSLELEAFIKAYHTAHWRVTLHDGSLWDAQLVSQPVSRAAIDRLGENTLTGKELIEVTLTLYAKRLS